jgi:hypothetical protein
MNWCNAIGVLKAATLRQLEPLGQKTCTIVDGWAANRKQVQAWEADGSLFEMAKEAGNQASDALARAKADGITHLAPHEIYELYGGPDLR